MRDLLFKLLGVLVLVGSVGAGWALMEWGDALQQELEVGDQGLRYTVNRGASFRSVVMDLADRGVLQKPRYLLWTARWTGKGQLGSWRAKATVTTSSPAAPRRRASA